MVKNDNAKNTEILNKAMPGFNDNSLNQLKEETENLHSRLIALSLLFDPKDKWVKKDYDFSIYFAEELGNINQALKTKAANKRISFTDLGFKEKLPAAQEAMYLLSQLYGLREVVNLGMDYGANFKTIAPEAVEEIKELTGFRLVKSRLELTCPGQTLIEFILQLNEITPKACFASLLLKPQEAHFEVNLSLENIVTDLDWKKIEVPQELGKIKEELTLSGQNFMRTLRANSPFFVPLEKENPLASQQQTSQTDERAKQLARFIYRGRGVLQSKDVVVIEDTLNQETLFLGLGERIDNFILKDFTDEHVVLKNINDKEDKELIIKRTVN